MMNESNIADARDEGRQVCVMKGSLAPSSDRGEKCGSRHDSTPLLGAPPSISPGQTGRDMGTGQAGRGVGAKRTRRSLRAWRAG